MSISESNKSKTKMKYIEAFCTLLNLLFFGEVRTNVGTTVRTNLILIIIQYVIENAFLSWIRVLVANLFLKLSLKLANSLLMDFFCPQKPLLWKLDGSGRLPQCDVCLGGNGDRRERKNSTLSPLLNRSVLNAGWKAHRKTIHCICEWLIFTIISVFLNVEI